MSHFADGYRKIHPGSLLSATRESSAPALPPEAIPEDPALRHEQARARRERRVNPLLSAPAGDIADPRTAGQDDAKAEQPAADDLATVAPFAAEPSAHPAETGYFEEAEAPDFSARPALAPARWASMRRSAAIMTVAGAAIGTALALGWPKSYVATSEVLIDPRETQTASMAAPLSSEAAFALVDNQLRVLRSGSMLNAVADRLNLASDSEFNGTSSGIGGILAGVSDLLAGDGGQAVEQRRRRVVEELAKAIQAERVGGSVVRVSASTADPQKSALIANTISELFVAGSARAPGDGGAHLAALRDELEKAERAVEAYKAESGLIDAQGRLITDDEILRVGEQLSTARARTVELNARASSARDADVDSIVTGSLPEQFASPTVAELRARHAELKQQLDRLSVKLGPRHPERLAAEAEMESARQDIRGELRRVAAALQTELKRAVQQEQELAAELARMKSRQASIGDDLVALRDLERDAGAKREAYESALRAAHSGAPAAAAGSASLISRAEPPSQAAGPSLPAFSLAGALAGLLAGLGFGSLRRPRAAAGTLPEHAYDDETAPDAFTGKEADDMNPYFAYAQPEQGSQSQPQQQAPQAAGYPQQPSAFPPAQPHMQQPSPYGYAQPSPMQPMPAYLQAPYPAPSQAAYAPAAPYPQSHQAMPPQMPQPAFPAHYYGAPPPSGYPAMQAPMPHDPWAHQRGFAPQPHPGYAAAPAFAPPAPPVHTVFYVPVPQAAAMPAAAAAEPARRPAREPAPRHAPMREAAYGEDSFVDERTDAAIEEIRQNLRAFREAIEDFAEERSTNRRYGT